MLDGESVRRKVLVFAGNRRKLSGEDVCRNAIKLNAERDGWPAPEEGLSDFDYATANVE